MGLKILFLIRVGAWLQIYCKKMIYKRMAGVNVKMTMYQDISHGFLNFNTINGMKEVNECISDAA